MKKRGLTERKMENKRFRKTENAIFVAYYTLRDYPSVVKVARRAGVSRPTFYRHHQAPELIGDDYEKYLFELFRKEMKKTLIKEDLGLKVVIFRMLIFIYGNREIFRALFRDGKKEIIGKMMERLHGRILTEWNLAGDLDKMFKIYVNEVLGVIEMWADKGFNDKEMEKVLDEIIYLTKTSPRRLARLIE